MMNTKHSAFIQLIYPVTFFSRS